MAKAPSKDIYANKAYGAVTESAAATLTFNEIQTNVNIFDKIAWVIHAIDWYISTASLVLLNASGDKIQMALTSSNQINTLELDNPSVIDLQEVTDNFATAVGFQIWLQPFRRDFTSMPGGGLIIAPRPLFVGCKDTGAGAACTVSCRIFFTQVQMQADEYLELVDFYRIVS